MLKLAGRITFSLLMAVPWAIVYLSHGYHGLRALFVPAVAFIWFLGISADLVRAQRFWTRPWSRSYAAFLMICAIATMWMIEPNLIWIQAVAALQAFVTGAWFGIEMPIRDRPEAPASLPQGPAPDSKISKPASP